MKLLKGLFLKALVLVLSLDVVGNFSLLQASAAPKKKVVFAGVNGFCNRLRVLASSVVIAEATNRDLLVYWSHPDEFSILGYADWNDLFVFPEFNRIDSLPKYGAIFNAKRNSDSPHLVMLSGEFCIPVEKEEMKRHTLSPGAEIALEIPEQYDEIVLQTIYNVKPVGMSNEEFYVKKREFYKSLIPVPYIKKAIKRYSREFTSNTIGIHVRTTDLQSLLNKNSKAPYWKYEEEMNQAIAANPNVNFFVSADTKQSLNHFIKLYGKKILYYPLIEYNADGSAQRSSMNATRDAIIDLYLLSKTSRLIGMQHSSFSYEAACLGGIPLKTLTFD